MEPKSAEWWEMQAGRYKAETAELTNEVRAVKAAAHEQVASYRAKVEELTAANAELIRKFTAQKSDLAQAARALADAVNRLAE